MTETITLTSIPVHDTPHVTFECSACGPLGVVEKNMVRTFAIVHFEWHGIDAAELLETET